MGYSDRIKRSEIEKKKTNPKYSSYSAFAAPYTSWPNAKKTCHDAFVKAGVLPPRNDKWQEYQVSIMVNSSKSHLLQLLNVHQCNVANIDNKRCVCSSLYPITSTFHIANYDGKGSFSPKQGYENIPKEKQDNIP
jgi:hypothetical protein